MVNLFVYIILKEEVGGKKRDLLKMENESQHFYLVWMCRNSTITLIFGLIFYSIFLRLHYPYSKLLNLNKIITSLQLIFVNF